MECEGGLVVADLAFCILAYLQSILRLFDNRAWQMADLDFLAVDSQSDQAVAIQAGADGCPVLNFRSNIPSPSLLTRPAVSVTTTS